MKVISFPLSQTRERPGIAGLLLFGVIGFMIPHLGWPQLITGTLVNALLILAVEWWGVKQAIFIGLVTPASAALRGVLPVPLLFMVPFISIGNTLLVMLYGRLRNSSPWLALIVAAAAKVSFLIASFSALVSQASGFIFNNAHPHSLILSAMGNMMGWIQLLTALAGGTLAFGMLRVAGRRKSSG